MLKNVDDDKTDTKQWNVNTHKHMNRLRLRYSRITQQKNQDVGEIESGKTTDE